MLLIQRLVNCSDKVQLTAVANIFEQADTQHTDLVGTEFMVGMYLRKRSCIVVGTAMAYAEKLVVPLLRRLQC